MSAYKRRTFNYSAGPQHEVAFCFPRRTLAERDVEAISLAAFFDRYTMPQDYWEPSQHELAPRFEALKDILASDLIDARVRRA